jgi:SAM-dependent methyltransferase
MSGPFFFLFSVFDTEIKTHLWKRLFDSAVAKLPLDYFTDDEYQHAFFEFGDFRRYIAEHVRKLALMDDCVIIDLLSGHGLLSAEMAGLFPQSKIIGIGLGSDVESFIQLRRVGKYPAVRWRKFQYLQCNATHLPIRSSSCDLIVNFLGLEDVLMTSGREGLKKLFDEIGRITRPGALVQITLVEYGNTPEEKLAKEIWQKIGLNAMFLSREEYCTYMEDQGFQFQEECVLNLKKKMTKRQAREELEFACKDTPKTFSQFGVSTIGLDELWRLFGPQIEEMGMAYWSTIRVMIFRNGS